ncbi:MAG TPA: right-handed parallel beta-helix repeat-containing protein [Xanthomonadaceae bacterium]
MKRYRAGLKLILVLLPVIVAAPAMAAVTVTVSPHSVAKAPNKHAQFVAAVAGSSDQNVTWLVNGVPGGAPSIGTISATGLYIAPADVPTAFAANVEAVAEADPLATGNASVNVSASVATGATWHVATTGSDSADGSAATPWKTIQHAAATVPAGSTVLVHGGVYKEAVTITRSGNATAGFTTYSAAPGESAIIDGTGLVVGNGGQQGLFTLHGASWVRVTGFEIRNFTSNTASKVPVGIYVYGSGNHIEILDNHVHDITTTVKTSAGDALGMAIYGSAATAISYLVIDGNEVDHLVTGYSESLTVNGNVQHWQVTHNNVHDDNNIGIDAIGFEQTAPTPAVDQARDGWIADNVVSHTSSITNPAYNDQPGADGIYVDGGTRIVIERNAVDHADLGIELASEHATRTSSYVTARDNLVSYSTITGISIGGYASGVGGTDHCTIVDNTLFENDTRKSGSGEFQIQFHATNNVFEDNILYANAQGLVVNSFVAASAAPATMDYNLYDASTGTAHAQWVWKNKTYTTLPAFRTVSGGEANGLLADPKFTSIAASSLDLHLATSSPGIDSGDDLGLAGVGLFDFAGDPRLAGAGIDRGAYER